MEIKKNRYGQDRSFEVVTSNKIRVMGETKFSRGSQDEQGNRTMFDFEGGPCFNINGIVSVNKMKYKIKKIQDVESLKEDLVSVILEVNPVHGR